MEGSPHRWTYIYSAVLGLVISSLEFINVWLTVWFRCAGVGLQGDRQVCRTLVFLMWQERKTFFLLSKRVIDHARHRFSAFEHCNKCLRFNIFQTFGSHLKILGAGWIIQGKFHFEEAQIFGATVRSPGICALLNIQLCFHFEVEGYRNMNKPTSLCCLILHSREPKTVIPNAWFEASAEV